MGITFLLLLLLMVSLTSASALKEGQSTGMDAGLLREDQTHSDTLNEKLRFRRVPFRRICTSTNCRIRNQDRLSNGKLEKGGAKAKDPHGFGR